MLRVVLASRAVPWVCVVAALAACAPSPVEWRDPVPLPPALMAASEIGFDNAGHLVPRTPLPVALPVFTAQCTATVRISGDSASGWFGVWWAVRDDSTADLVVSHSPDGANWSPTTRVDSTDGARSGCSRPPPAIFVEGQNLHIAYPMNAREGAGIFVAHSMDNGMTFHTPVTVAYGERIGRVAIAARGDLVAVAYEDPNANPGRIGVALSRAAGHLFESHVTASPPSGEAHAPGVALGDGVIAVTWAAAAPSNASAPRIVRIGALR